MHAQINFVIIRSRFTLSMCAKTVSHSTRFLLAPLAALACTFVQISASADYGDLPPQSDVTTPNDTSANEPTSRSAVAIDWELAAIATYVTPPIRGGTTPFGFGFGGRVGLRASHHLYFGAEVTYYLGGTDVTLADQALLYGLAAGYDVVLHRFDGFHGELALRPLVGVGVAAVSHTDPSIVQNAKVDVVTTASGRTISGGAPSATNTIDNIYLRPALSLMFIREWQFAALEGSVLIVPGIGYGGADPTTWLSYGAQLLLGARF